MPEESQWRSVHAIEFRINAENPAAGFMPSPGSITRWIPPSGDDIRLDTFASEGMQVQPFYDSMVAKLIITGESREAAIARSREALDAFEIDGIATTASFHRSLLENTDFQDNRIHTRWVEQSFLPPRPKEKTHG